MLDAIYDVEEVTDVEDFRVSLNTTTRKLTVIYKVLAGEISIEGRLTLDV